MRYTLFLACLVAMLALFVGIDSAYAQTPAVNVTSTTDNGTYTEGTIDVRLVSPESFLFEGFSIVDGTHHFGVLDQAYSVTTTQIGSKYYALVTAYGDDNGVQIIDITTPTDPISVANITDDANGFGELLNAASVTTTQIGGNHYALVASQYDDGVQIIGINTPSNPISVANITDDANGFGELYGAYSITTTQIGGNHYALVAAHDEAGVQIIDITTPSAPISVANITDNTEFDELNGARSVTTTQIGGNHYALVASQYDDGVQIIGINTPSNPISVANITDDADGFGVLAEATSVTTTQIGGNHYALVTSQYDHGVQIIDITTPSNPISVANITDDADGFGVLAGATSVTSTKIGSNHYALVASNVDHGVQIIDITTPASPISIANITDDSGGFDNLLGARSITTTQIGSNHYALVASSDDNGVQIIDITDPAKPFNPLWPFIALDTDPPARAFYKEINGNDDLVFEYDVGKYDYSPRLAYAGADAFHVSSYTLTYANGTSFPTTLPQPGSIGSLSYNKAIQIGLTPPNNIDPVIRNTGPVTVSLGATFITSVTCTDDVDASPTLTHTLVDTSTSGPQTVTYTCTDSSGNTVTATQSVTVTPDSTRPTIMIPGDNPFTITEGDTYSVPAATCTDDVDGSLTPDVSGTVDPNTPGTYTVAYTCTDLSDNAATATLRVVVNVDVAPYAVSIETGEPDTIIVTMSEAVQNVSDAGFTISGIVSDSSISISSVGSAADVVTVTLSDGMLDSDSPRLAYNGTTGTITDLRGKPLASFDELVQNTLDTTAPTVRSVTIDNSGTVFVRLSESIQQGSAVANDFTTNNSSITVSSISVSGSTITLELSGEIPDDAALTLSYTGGEGGIADLEGNHLESFDDEPINKQSRKRSSSGSTPAVDLASLQSLGYMDYDGTKAPHDPYAPITPLNAGGSSGFALAINDMHYLLGGILNTLEPQTLLTGVDNTISFAVYDRADIAHFTLYMNLHGQDTDYQDSDTYITYDMGSIRIVDPHDLISDATVSIKTSGADSLRHIVVFAITFEGEMEQTNLVARTWNTDASSTIVRILNAFAVSAAPPDTQPALSEDPVQDDPVPEDPVPDNVMNEPEESEPAGATPDPNAVKMMIRTWSGFEPGSVTDAQLLEALGLEHDGNIPSWVMTELGVLLSQDQITLEEFTTAISYVLANV